MFHLNIVLSQNVLWHFQKSLGWKSTFKDVMYEIKASPIEELDLDSFDFKTDSIFSGLP
jgi:hypothetical protein